MADKGNKGQKIGRAARRPSTAKYKLTKRSEINAKRKQAQHAKKCLTKVHNVPRGTARKMRRDAVRSLFLAQPVDAVNKKPLSAFMK